MGEIWECFGEAAWWKVKEMSVIAVHRLSLLCIGSPHITSEIGCHKRCHQQRMPARSLSIQQYPWGTKIRTLAFLGFSTFSVSAAVVFFLGGIVMNCFAGENYDKWHCSRCRAFMKAGNNQMVKPSSVRVPTLKSYTVKRKELGIFMVESATYKWIAQLYPPGGIRISG